MTRLNRFGAVVFALLLFAVQPAFCSIISTTGAIVSLPLPPSSVALNALQSNTTGVIFEEKSNFSEGSNLNVNTTASGTYTLSSQLTGGSIAAGTVFDSFFLHFDAVTGTRNYIGSVTFSTAILGVIVTDASLNNTDSTLGAAGTTYPHNLVFRGLELGGNQGDAFSISSNMKTISFNFWDSTATDEVRVLTAVPSRVNSVPEPGTWALAVTALIGLALLRRRSIANQRVF